MQPSTNSPVKQKKEICFVNKGAKKDFENLPQEARTPFMQALEMISYGQQPGLSIEHLGDGKIELRINGSPAYRCVYKNKDSTKVEVLHAFTKTTNGVDRKNMKTVKKRSKV